MKAPTKKVNLTSSHLDAELQESLRRIFPEAFSEGKINWDRLKAILGETIDFGREKFGFTWSGKGGAIQNVLMPSKATLKPDEKESVKFDETENLFIEGDNLEVLKLLQKSYFEKVKMIYIDPPYNTGGDFVYKDNYAAPLKNYLEQTGQKDSEGNNLQTNRESSGRYHSDWLSMMYPRLKLARNLLKDTGVIFVSIDDSEVHHLRILMNEIYGEENFEGLIHWRRRHNQPNDATKMIGLVAEHILVYAKDSAALKADGVGKVGLTGQFSNPDDDPRGDWASKPWKVGSGQSGSRYIITTPTGLIYDEDWMGEENTFKTLLEDKRIIFPDKGKGAPRKKYFKFEREEEGQSATNWWSHEQFGSNQEGSNELYQLLGSKDVFDNPKPIKLIENLISLANVKDGEIVFDFFAGSGTTAHAVLKVNKEAEKNIRFLTVQLPEILNENNVDQKAGYIFCKSISKPTNIAEISKERIRRAISGIGEVPSVGGGFKVFKLSESNYPENLFDFDPEKSDEENAAAFEEYLSTAKQNTLLAKYSEIDVVYEVILKEGLSLNSQVEKTKIGKSAFYKVSSDSKVVLISLDQSIGSDTAKLLTESQYKGNLIVCLDEALDDSTKANLALNVELKTI